MKSPLRPHPDYCENPHDGSEPSGWLKYSGKEVDTSIQPAEEAFFEDLVGAFKKGYAASFMDTPSGETSPLGGSPSSSIFVHPKFPSHDSDSYTGLTQPMGGPTEGFAGEVINSIHSAADENPFADLAKGATDAVKGLQDAQNTLSTTPTPAPASTPPTTAPAASTPKTPTTPAVAPPTTAPVAPTAPATPTVSPSQSAIQPQAAPHKQEGQKSPSSTTYSTGKATPPTQPPVVASIHFDPNAYALKSMSERAHDAAFQSNPFMTFNQSVLDPGGQYNDMNYNPRPSYFEEGTGDSSCSNLHNKNNGNYSRDSLNFGGVTDMLVVRPADPRWTNDPVDLGKMLPMTGEASSKMAALANLLDHTMMKQAQQLGTDDNPYLRDYSEVRPLNADLDFSVNAPEKDPNDPQNQEDVGGSLHMQPNIRTRARGPQAPMGQFDPNQATTDSFITTVNPTGAMGARYTLPGWKESRPFSELCSTNFLPDH